MLQSWIERKADETHSRRKLSTTLQGLECGIYRGGTAESNVVQRINITVDVDKTDSRLTVVAGVSDVRVNLSYEDFVSLNCVVKKNINKP